MNPGQILKGFAEHEVDCLLVGGMNFFLRHRPVSTFDVDFWVADNEANLKRVAAALVALRAERGAADGTWGPVPSDCNWLRRQPVHCLTSPSGAIDIFRFMAGCESYEACRARSAVVQTRDGTSYRSLADADMLACQLALPESQRRLDRVAYLEKLLRP